MHTSPQKQRDRFSFFLLRKLRWVASVVVWTAYFPSAQALDINVDPALGTTPYGRFLPDLRTNPDFLFSGVDFSGVSTGGGMTMISPQHFICAWHAASSVGAAVEFRNRDNVTKTYFIGGYLDLGLADMAIGYLTAPIPESDKITHLPVVKAIKPGDDFSWYEQPGQIYVIGGNNGFARLSEVKVYPAASVSIIGWGWTPGGEYHTAKAVSGDSGKPVAMIYNNQLTIIGANWTATGATFLPNHIDRVNQVMAATTPGSAYQLTVIDPFVSPSPTVWTGATSNVWSTAAANWSSGAWANSGQAALFQSGGTEVELFGFLTADSLTLAQGAEGFSFSGQTLTLGGGGLAANESVIFTGPMDTSLGQTWTVASGKTLTLSGPLNLSRSTLTIEGGGNTAILGVVFDTRSDPSFLGPLPKASGNLIKKGSGALTLTNANTFTGQARIADGLLALEHTDALQSAALELIAGDSGTVSLNGITELSIGGLSGTRDLSGALGGAALSKLTLKGAPSPGFVYSGAITNVTLLEKVGPGTQTLKGTNSFLGGVVLKEGYLGIESLDSVGGTGTSVLFDGGVLQLTGTTLTTLSGLSLTASPNKVIAIDTPIQTGAESLRITSIPQSLAAVGFVKTGGPLVVLSGNNTFGSEGILNRGRLSLTGSNTLSGPIHNESELAISSLANIGGAGTFMTSRTWLKIEGTNLSELNEVPGLWSSFSGSLEIVEPAHTFTVGVPIEGTGTLTKRGQGLLVLTAANTFSGVTTPLYGSLRLDHPMALQNSAVDVRSTSQLQFGPITQAHFGGLTGSTSGINGTSAPLTLTNSQNQPVELIMGSNDGSSNYPGNIGGLGGLTKTGAGSYSFSGLLSYAGVTKVEEGFLNISVSSLLSGPVQVGAGVYRVEVPANGSYLSRNLRSSHIGSGALQTEAVLIGGSNSSSAVQTLAMSWRSRGTGENEVLSSDVVSFSGAASVFLGTNTTTGGTWPGVFGGDGYHIIGTTPAYPAYATVTSAGKSEYTWEASTAEPRALQKPGSSDRVASTWYSSGSFTVDVSFSDVNKHKVTLYFLDWDSNTRAQTVEVIDVATQAVLDSRTLSSFQNGVYLSWNLSGSVRFRFTRTGGSNAVLQGLFFDPGSAAVGGAPYVLSMAYDPATLHGPEENLRLMTKVGGDWTDAVLGNIGGTANFLNRAYNPATDFAVGNYGVDTSTNTVWAVLDYSAEFAAGDPNPPELGETYADWAGVNGYNLVGDAAAPDFDADGDGLSNLLEYAFGGDPTESTSGAALQPVVDMVSVEGEEYLTITFRRRLLPASFSAIPESSSDLTTWPGVPLQVGETIPVEGGLFETVTFQDQTPTSGGSPRFIRVRANL